VSLVKYTLDDRGVARLTLNRAEKLNAFSRALCDEYLKCLDAANSDVTSLRARVVLIDSATEKAFCAGADLKERATMNEAQINEQLKIQREMMDRTAALNVPTAALISGVAFGGGLELALCCDFRFAHVSSQMGLTELRLGIIPGSGGTQRLSRLVGEAKAKEMIMLAKRIGANEAKHIGLVNEVGSDLIKLSEDMIDSVLETAPLAQLAAKKAIELGTNMEMPQALDFERLCYDKVLKSQDRIEGLQAFIEKRKPKFQGK
jgi:methylglutaconyl-CoA hydratase